MDKQNYKELLAESIELVGQTAKEVNRLQLLVAGYTDKLNHIWKLVEDESNDITLGKMIRQLYWEHKGE